MFHLNPISSIKDIDMTRCRMDGRTKQRLYASTL